MVKEQKDVLEHLSGDVWNSEDKTLLKIAYHLISPIQLSTW